MNKQLDRLENVMSSIYEKIKIEGLDSGEPVLNQDYGIATGLAMIIKEHPLINIDCYIKVLEETYTAKVENESVD